MALYNEMRPQVLDEVKGQEATIKILKESILKGKIPQAMLFVGTRGTGKTTVSRIIAKMVNCQHPKKDGAPCGECDSCRAIQSGTSLDVFELDAASNNSVENIRNLIQQLDYNAVGKKRVAILDEVHMLSTGAFNALLKTLEEPPQNVLIILCTTERHKVPATIISRCRTFQFHSMESSVIVEKLQEINAKYQKEADLKALELVAKAAKGSMRDAESIYESFLECEGAVTVEMVRRHLGLSSEEKVYAILDSIRDRNPMMAKATIEECVDKGESLTCLLEDVFSALMDILSVQLGGDVTGAGDAIGRYAFEFSSDRLFAMINSLRKAYEQKNANLALSIEAAIIGLVSEENTIGMLESRIADLEKRMEELMHRPMAVSEEVSDPIPDPDGTDCLEEEPAEELLISPKELDTMFTDGERETLKMLEAAGFTVAVSGTPFDKPDPVTASVSGLTTDVESGPVEEEKGSEDCISDGTGQGASEDYFDAFARLFN